MSRLVPAPDALVGKRFDVAVAKMLGNEIGTPLFSEIQDRESVV